MILCADLAEAFRCPIWFKSAPLIILAMPVRKPWGEGPATVVKETRNRKARCLVSILWDRLDMEWIVSETIHMRPHSSRIATPSEQLNQVVFWRHIVSP